MMHKTVRHSFGFQAAALCVAAASLAVAGETPPAKRPPPGSMTIYGKVDVEKSQAGKIAAVTVTTFHKITYRVALDETGQRLGEAMAGQRAKVVGTPTGDGQARDLTVHSFGPVGKDGQKPGAPPRKPSPPKKPTPPRRTTGKTTSNPTPTR